MSPVTPKNRIPKDAVLKFCDEGSQYHVADHERQTAMSDLPSPSKSMSSGISPYASVPHCTCPAVAYRLLDVSQNQVPVPGLQTTSSALPSPSRSPSIG